MTPDCSLAPRFASFTPGLGISMLFVYPEEVTQVLMGLAPERTGLKGRASDSEVTSLSPFEPSLPPRRKQESAAGCPGARSALEEQVSPGSGARPLLAQAQTFTPGARAWLTCPAPRPRKRQKGGRFSGGLPGRRGAGKSAQRRCREGAGWGAGALGKLQGEGKHFLQLGRG